MSKLKTEGVAEFINDAIKTFENCGLLPSELLRQLYDELQKERGRTYELRKLQQQNQELRENQKSDIIAAFLAGRKAGAAFKRASDNEGLAEQYYKENYQ